ncbi:Glycosyl transferase family 11 [compost metagenome]
MGNQMFQYALGKHLALRNKSKLKLDLSFFENYEWHEYSLAPFNIIEDFAEQSDINRLKKQKLSLLERVMIKLRLTSFSKSEIWIKEHGMEFHPEILKLSGEKYLDGYWQSEQYFQTIETAIRNDFQVKVAPSNKNAETLNLIEKTNAISIHFRRGNYESVPEVNKAHGISPLSYYQLAINHIVEKVNNPCFFIFSDDMQWVKENFQLDFEHYFVDHNDDKTDYEDMRLMYCCKHNIIANSTFSWWGAWLNPNPEKVVIAPKKWFNDETRETKDILPTNWIKF